MKRTYRTTNWSAYNAALKARGSLTLWLDPQMTWAGRSTGRRGRRPGFSDEAIQCCLTFKGMFGLSLRQTVGFVESLFCLAGLDWAVPDYSTLSRRQGQLTVVIPARAFASGLVLLVDSTGVKVSGEGEWKTRQYGATYRRRWLKVHLGVDAQTLEIRAIGVTNNSLGDASILPEFLDQLPGEERLVSVCADGAYDTRNCHEAIAQKSAQAMIPPRNNARLWKEGTPGALTRHPLVHCVRTLRAKGWKRLSGYHRRSRIEAKMRCFKLLGERLSARDFDRQVAEVHLRAVILNRFTHLGTPLSVRL